jgi:5'-phosphate synthase pdxT subunit
MPQTVGVIAIQGDFLKHIEALRRTKLEGLKIVEVRTPEELAQVNRVIIPGGESTTVGLLMQRYGLGEALINAAMHGMPMWGTCMGMIMLSKEVIGKPDQYTLNLLDITVERNAFGAQVHSFEDSIDVTGMDKPVLGVFIRAPIVSRVGEGVQVLSRYNGKVVAVRQGNIVGTSFHPELTLDSRFHRWFLDLSGRSSE